MPRYKRYAPIDHDINHDAEVWAFTTKFGDRSFRTLAQIVINIDKTENRWKLVDDWAGTLSRTVRQSSANVRRQVDHMIAVGWLRVVEQAADGSPLVLEATNYWKYHRSEDRKNKNNGTEKKVLTGPPNHTLPNLTNITPKSPLTGVENGNGKTELTGNRLVAAAGKYSHLE